MIGFRCVLCESTLFLQKKMEDDVILEASFALVLVVCLITFM